MKKLLQIGGLMVIVGLLVWKSNILANALRPKSVQAVGALTFDLGVPDGSPIFSLNNIAPGFSQTKSIIVHNDDTKARLIGIKGIQTGDIGNLDNAMDIEISQNSSDIYGGTAGTKTLAEFFSDSATVDGVSLTTIAPNTSTSYEVTITFNQQAGNEYQDTNMQFNLQFGIVTNVPIACDNIHFDHTITGTAGSDVLHGTNGNDLILGLEGNNKIDSGNGDDCIIVGDGNNKIDAGNGNDVVMTGNGNNTIDGGNGDDIITTGNGNNNVQGGNGDDTITTGSGQDKIDGGNGNDNIHSGAGNDTLIGGNGNDILDGEDGIDTANGGNGKDTCIAETRIACEL